MRRFVVIVAIGVMAARAHAQDATTVRLQSREILLSPATTSAFVAGLEDTTVLAMHGLAYLRRLPTSAERGALARAGLTLLESLGRGVFYASVSRSFDSSRPVIRTLLAALAPLTPEDRVASDLWQRRYGVYRARTADGDTVNYVVNADSTLRVTVRFHRDVPVAATADLLRRHRATVPVMTGPAVSAVVSRSGLEGLAAADQVAWIDADLAPLLPDNDVSRQAIGADQVQRFDVATGLALGLSGSGVQVGVFDLGIDETHADLLGRVPLPHSSASLHGTLVAGIIAASGSASDKPDSWGQSNGGSPFQWRGMAPAAELIEQSTAVTSTAEFVNRLYSYISNGGDVSNHSHTLEANGGYGELSRTMDDVIRGNWTVGTSPVPPRLQVYSAGNKGSGLRYFTLNKELKNAVIVGNWDVPNTRLFALREGSTNTIFATALGPTEDGRLKPDVVAPGSWVRSTGYWDAAFNEGFMCPDRKGTGVRRNFYAADCGTSLAAPMVTGALALVLQQYQETYVVDLDQDPPLPSTLRAIVVHTAQDLQGDWSSDTAGSLTYGGQPALGFAGPDFATGFGMVDALAAVDVVRGRRVREGTVANTCDVRVYWFHPPGGAGVPVKVTLAWDDPAAPGSTGDVARLVNDLDLVLIDPNDVRHYPWVLGHTVTDAAGNPLAPESQACGSDPTVTRTLIPGGLIDHTTVVPAGTGRDRLNNVEQVVAPYTPGMWRAEVTAFRLEESQAFSLVGVPLLVLPPSPVATRTLCQRIPRLCQPVIEQVCVRVPELCARPPMWELRDDALRLVFRGGMDLVIVPLQELCPRLRQPADCGSAQDSTAWILRLGPTYPGLLSAGVLASTGRQLGEAVIGPQAQVLRWPAVRGDYYLVLRPTAGTQLNTPISLPIMIGR